MSDVDKRLQALERGLLDERKKREAANAELDKLKAENKRLRAQAVDTARQAGQTVSALNGMRDLAQGPENPYAADARARYEELKSKTLVDKGGMAYYFTSGPAYVGHRYYVGFDASVKGDPSDYIIVVPKETDPSMKWEPVELGGVDAKTGAPIFRPLGTGAKMEAAIAAKRAEVESQFITNTELNERRGQQTREAAKLGPGGATAGEQESNRPSDTTVG